MAGSKTDTESRVICSDGIHLSIVAWAARTGLTTGIGKTRGLSTKDLRPGTHSLPEVPRSQARPEHVNRKESTY